jgi:hypothetical protein
MWFGVFYVVAGTIGLVLNPDFGIAGRDAHPDESHREELDVGVIPRKDRVEVSAVRRREALLRHSPDQDLTDARARR